MVADTSMMQFHEDGDVETYLLTIMNMVSSLYKDPTIGNSVHVVVVKIILLEDEESYQELNVTQAAVTTLDSFCRYKKNFPFPSLSKGSSVDATLKSFNLSRSLRSRLVLRKRWQRTLNPKKDDDPQHHDVAILVTRQNICSSAGCATLGIANVGGMCRADKSCSVNEDNGITLAHTIAHELGHK